MEKPYVFISYSTKDQAYANKVCEVLKANGIDFWIATKDIHGGDSYASEITTAIEGCKAFVFLLSDNSDDSPHCGNELSLAVSNKKKVLPFRLHEFALSPSVMYFLQQTQWIDAFVDEEVAFSELIEKINFAFSSKEVAREKVKSLEEKKVDNLIKRAYLDLDLANFNEADRLMEEALVFNMECAEAYFIKLLCEVKKKNIDELVGFSLLIEEKQNYKFAKRFAKGEFLEKFNEFEKNNRSAIKFKRIEAETKEYFDLEEVKSRLIEIEDFAPASELLKGIDALWQKREEERKARLEEQRIRQEEWQKAKEREEVYKEKFQKIQAVVAEPFDTDAVRSELVEIKDYEPARALLSTLYTVWERRENEKKRQQAINYHGGGIGTFQGTTFGGSAPTNTFASNFDTLWKQREEEMKKRMEAKQKEMEDKNKR